MNYINLLLSRYRLIIKYTGLLVIMVGAVILTPLLTLFFYPGDSLFISHFLLSSFGAIVTGIILYYIAGPKNKNVTLTLEEGGIIVVISWVMAIFFSSLPFVFGLNMSWTHAIFEVVSGWTTTGLSVIDVSKTPKIYLLWRSIMQMFGGAGLAVIALSSIMPMPGMGLYMAEGRSDQLLPHVHRSTRMIMQIYLGYIFGGSLLYYLAGMNLFDAINHSMAAISTGGFSTVQESIGYWDSLGIELVTIILMFLGTVNFATHYTLIQKKFRIFFRNGEIRLMGILLFISIPLVTFISLYGVYETIGESLRNSTFQLVSALSTTGFSTIDFNFWPIFANLFIIVFMIIGGGTGSTAGGLKQYRVYLIFKSLFWDIKRNFYPRNQVIENYVWRGDDKWYIKSEHIREVANFIFLYLITYIIGVFIFLASGFKLKESLFEFASALGTVGLSIGITGADAPNLILWTEIFGMILGRLEFMVIIFAFVKLFKDGNYYLNKKG